MDEIDEGTISCKNITSFDREVNIEYFISGDQYRYKVLSFCFRDKSLSLNFISVETFVSKIKPSEKHIIVE